MADSVDDIKHVELVEVTATVAEVNPVIVASDSVPAAGATGSTHSAAVAVCELEDELDAEEAQVDSPFFWHHAKTSRDFANWEDYPERVAELKSFGSTSESIEELHIAGAPSFPETDEDSYEELNLRNLRKHYMTHGVEFTDAKKAELKEWYTKYKTAIEELDEDDKVKAKKIMDFSENMMYVHLNNQSPLLHIFLDKFLPSCLNGCFQRCTKWTPRMPTWTPRLAREVDSDGKQKSMSGQRNVKDLLIMHNFMMLMLLLSLGFPIFSSIGPRLKEIPILTAQACSFMAPSISASKFPSQSDFLMNQSSWSIEMFSTVGIFKGFTPSGEVFAEEYKAAGKPLPPVETCVLSTPVSIKVDPSAPYDIVRSGNFEVYSSSPLVYDLSKQSRCVGYNDEYFASKYLATLRGMADYWVLSFTYMCAFGILGNQFNSSRNMSIAFQNRSILIDTRTMIHKYFNAYRMLFLALAYLICVWQITSIWGVWVLVPLSSKSQDPCTNFQNNWSPILYSVKCAVCSDLQKPVSVYYEKTYTGSIFAAFNQSFFIAIALFQMCTMILAKYNFVDGDQFVSPNERHSAYRNLHTLRQRFTIGAQADDYVEALEERRLDWCIQQPGFAPVLKQVGDADQQKPPRKTPNTKRYYYTLKELREISKITEFPDEVEDWWIIWWKSFQNFRSQYLPC